MGINAAVGNDRSDYGFICKPCVIRDRPILLLGLWLFLLQDTSALEQDFRFLSVDSSPYCFDRVLYVVCLLMSSA